MLVSIMVPCLLKVMKLYRCTQTCNKYSFFKVFELLLQLVGITVAVSKTTPSAIKSDRVTNLSKNSNNVLCCRYRGKFGVTVIKLLEFRTYIHNNNIMYIYM